MSHTKKVPMVEGGLTPQERAMIDQVERLAIAIA